MAKHEQLEIMVDPIIKLDTLLAQTALFGYAFDHEFLQTEALTALTNEAYSLDLEVGDHISQPINKGAGNEVRQSHARAYRAIGEKDIPVANNVTRKIAHAVHNLTDSYPNLQSWMPTEAGYQLYRDDGDYISAHRDRASDQLLAVTFNVTGSTTVEIYKTPSDNPLDYTHKEKIDEFTTQPGSVMFLRAPGFDDGNMLQTLHAVLPPTTKDRLVLNLRMRPTILKNPLKTKWQ